MIHPGSIKSNLPDAELSRSAWLRWYGTIAFLLIATTSTLAQEVKNIRVSQVVNRVNIVYDLEGQYRYYHVSLFYSVDEGKNWLGPLKNVNGNVGENQEPGTNKTIVWDALAEKGPIEGIMQFKVVAELSRQGVKTEEKQATAKSQLMVIGLKPYSTANKSSSKL